MHERCRTLLMSHFCNIKVPATCMFQRKSVYTSVYNVLSSIYANLWYFINECQLSANGPGVSLLKKTTSDIQLLKDPYDMHLWLVQHSKDYERDVF